MLATSLLCALLAAATSAVTYEARTSYGYMVPKMYDGPHFRINDGVCNGYMNIKLHPFDKMYCNGSEALRLEAYAYHDQPYPSLVMEDLASFLATKGSNNCSGVMHVQTRFACSGTLLEHHRHPVLHIVSKWIYLPAAI